VIQSIATLIFGDKQGKRARRDYWHGVQYWWTCSSPSNSQTDDNFTDRVFALDNRRIQKALPEGRPGDDLDPPPV
jgi:hypothetical protein